MNTTLRLILTVLAGVTGTMVAAVPGLRAATLDETLAQTILVKARVTDVATHHATHTGRVEIVHVFFEDAVKYRRDPLQRPDNKVSPTSAWWVAAKEILKKYGLVSRRDST